MLTDIALRLLSTPANSVPSKRSFLSFNFTQNSFRTYLLTRRTDLLLYIYINCRALEAQPWLEAQKRERLKRRREIALSEGYERKKLRLELLEALTLPSIQALAPWNLTTNDAIEQQMALIAPLELTQSYLNEDEDDDDDSLLLYEASQSLPSLSYYNLLSSTPLLACTPPSLPPSFSHMSTQGEPAYTPLRALPQPLNSRGSS